MSILLDTCADLGKPIIEEMGYSLVDVEFVKEGRIYVLRYLVDSANGVDIEDCATMSEKISHVLDSQDPINEEYILEISSPGAERPLKTKEDIKNALNKYVNIRLYAPIDKRKEYEGDLVAFDDDVLTLKYKEKTKEKTVQIKFELISKIRLAIKF